MLTLIKLSWAIIHLTKPEFLMASNFLQNVACYTFDRHTETQLLSNSILLYKNTKYQKKKSIKIHCTDPHIENIFQTHSGFYTEPQMEPLPYRKSVSRNESHFNGEGGYTASLLTNQKRLTFWCCNHQIQ